MKIGCCSSRWLTLVLLALLRTFTLVLTQQISQQCRQLMQTCADETSTPPLLTLATGLESRTAMCTQPIDQIMTGDMLEWYFTRTTIENKIMVNTSNADKYITSGSRRQNLEVRNINSRDEGYYFCRTRRSGDLLPDPIQGTCLYVYNPAMFQTCSGEGNINTAQGGCNGTEQLTSQVGQSVEFNIALVHNGTNENCNNQLIQMITLRKIDSSSSPSPLTVECSNSSCCSDSSCHPPMNFTRLNVSRTLNEFDINITLNDLTEADSGSYSAIADIRRPTNIMRVCIYKNFSLVVQKPTTAPTTTDETQTTISSSSSTPAEQSSPLSMGALIAIAVVIVVLVLLLIGLGVFVAILLLWTCKHRSKSGQSDLKVYETIKDFVRRDKKKNKNGGPLTEEAVYQRRSYAEEEKVTLPDGLNSESNPV